MIDKSEDGLSLWRVGYHADPLGFTPRDLYEFSHRFDDIHRRFRTLYCAELAETCLREVLVDFRPNLSAVRRHVERYGPEAAQDFAKQPVTAVWRRQHVLIAPLLRLDGPLIDLTDVPTRQQWCRSRQAFVAQRRVDASAARTSAAEAGAAGWVLYWSSLVTA